MRTVLVTGGSRGLGLALVEALLADGHAVATCSRQRSSDLDRVAAEPGFSGRLFWHPADVADTKAAAAFVAESLAWAAGRPLWGLVNNAGIAREGVLATFPEADAAAVLETNLMGALRMCRLALRTLLVQGGAGRIVNVSSILGSRGYTGLAAYAASKAGLEGMTRALAREVGRRGITVNAVAPGYLETELSATLDPGQRRQIIRRTPLGRLGTVADVVPAVRFLLSDGAAFITGHTLTVDGGLTC